ncbi:hypothetical protein [Acinetobacter bohemicus]|uniref:hypothetical protein n=1 Tax=Acinetobacter bohemicus TaxID=1435036 RepID=UPI0040426A50
MTKLLVPSTAQREQLLAQQSTLAEQVKQLQFQLFDKTSPDVVEHISQLQLEKAKQQGILQQAQRQLAQLTSELKNFDTGAEQILLEAIIAQDWYGFKNKELILFDKRNGFLFPNFAKSNPILFSSWDKYKDEYSPHGIGAGKWDINREEFFTFFYMPNKFRGNTSITVIYGYNSKADNKYSCTKNYCANGNHENVFTSSLAPDVMVLPKFRVLSDENILNDSPNLTKLEKAKIILEFFTEQAWIPNFEPFLTKNDGEDEDGFQERLVEVQKQCDEYNCIFDAYYQRLKLQKQLVVLEQQISELPESEPENQFTSDFDYRQEIKSYHLTEINTSVWQNSLSAQKWINYLLNQIDGWGNNHQYLLVNALELNISLAKKLPISLNLNDYEQQLLNHRHTTLKQRLNFSLDPLRSALIYLLQQNQQIETSLQMTHSLVALAELEQQPRPSFTLLAEHTATLCTQTLKKLEWLENSLGFVQAIVKSEQQGAEDYFILLDKSQQDLLQIGLDASIESEEVGKWFAEWRQERLQILQQWQPLIQAGLDGIISEQMVLDTLQCLAQYQQNLDKFYIEKRLGIHTTYAFQAYGNHQEKLEKEQELTKLIHQFMQDLEKVIFASQNTAQKIWLVRFSEVWQQGIVQEVIEFLKNEELLDRSDIAQILSEEMRKIQQQNLASCLQDVKSYSQALAQRDKDFSTLIFKMRKALQK